MPSPPQSCQARGSFLLPRNSRRWKWFWDRLEKAGLRPFCFNLHAQGLTDGCGQAVFGREGLDAAAGLRAIAVMSSKRQAWTRRRDGLRTYARVIGTKVGKLEETVHDVLWRTIDRKRFGGTGLPPAVSAAQLANVEDVAPADVDEARSCIRAPGCMPKRR